MAQVMDYDSPHWIKKDWLPFDFYSKDMNDKF